MNDYQIDDLKQFILATSSQTEARIMQNLGGEISQFRTELKGEINELRTEMRGGFEGVAVAFEETHRIIEENKVETDVRLTRLESHFI